MPFNILTLRILTIGCLLLISCSSKNDVWSSVYYCDPKTDGILCDKNIFMYNRYVVYHTVVKTENMYKHFIWLLWDSPRIIITETGNNCSLFINYSLFISKQPNNSIRLIYNNDMCKPIYGYDQLSFTSIQEINDTKILKEYVFSDIFNNVTNTKINDILTAYILFNGSAIQFTLSTNTQYSFQFQLPFLKLSTFNNLINLQISGLKINTNSCDSIFVLNFHLSTNKNTTLLLKDSNLFSDDSGPGIFRTHEIFHDSINKIEPSRFSFFWKAVSYAEPHRKRSTMLDAQLENFKLCEHSNGDLIISSTVPLQSVCGSIKYSVLNTENCFFYKSYIVWESTIGS
ncbi:hypothetical protein HZS_5048, partial [Henneguya salminicola]